MKIIDAHMHLWPGSMYFERVAKAAGQENSATFLEREYAALGYVGGVIMGNQGLTLSEHVYPACFRYCIGISFHEPERKSQKEMVALAEKHLQQPQCCGVKLYPGYDPMYLYDDAYRPYYELARLYKKPVAIHMGITAGIRATLKYAHPLTLDEVALSYPDVQFVMCHFGNPWLMDAAAVVMKNENVAADLSGLFEGRLDVGRLTESREGYVGQLRAWIGFVGNREKFLYGTDWPLVHLKEYAEVIASLFPDDWQEHVFYRNAVRVYGF